MNISAEASVSPDDPGNFINTELSWLKFNQRVLEEAMDERQPLLARVKFLAICGSNIDEFFMVRVASLRRQLATGKVKARPERMSPAEQLDAIRKELIPLIAGHARCWHELLPELGSEGILINRYGDLEEKQKALLRRFFEYEIFPTLTPLAFDAAHPFPFISNLTINIAVVVMIAQGDFEKQMFSRVKVPTGLFSRFIAVPEVETGESSEQGAAYKKNFHFVLLEDLIAANLDMLFPGMEVVASYPFRITRDAEIKSHLNGADDLATQVKESLEFRRTGPPVRLEVDVSMPDHIRHMLASKLGLPSSLVNEIEGIMGTADLWELMRLDRPDLKDARFLPSNPSLLDNEKKIFQALRTRDALFYYPYDSFLPFIKFLHRAAQDPDVLAIKITLYRIDANSQVIDALIKARQNGKQVAAVVELTARFDEENNIGWAHELEREGVHVVYGSPGLKVHAKLCLVVRREGKEIIRYGYLSSGNFNAVTSRIYGDLGYFTCNPHICADMSQLFNALTGYYGKQKYHKLLVAPYDLRREFLGRIEREIKRHREHGDGYMAFKNNGLTDMEIILALYRASQAGVKIDLNVRALCALRPGIPGISENIRVTSIVGRFLEHARIYYFRNGGDEEVLLGSADLRTRNFDERVETLFPVENPDIKYAVIKDILNVHLKDNVKARRLLSDGAYERVAPFQGERELNSQEWLIENRSCGIVTSEMKENLKNLNGYCFFGADTIRPLLRSLSREIEGVREAEDIEFIHRMRVASRRIRSCLPLFEDCLPPKKYRQWRKEIRNITRALREARDADVQIAFLKTYIEKLEEESLRPGVQRFLLRLRQRRERVQPRVIKAIDRFLKSGVVEDMEKSCRKMQRRHTGVNSPEIYQKALTHITSRLEEMFAHEASVYIPENIEEHHAMRIAVKRLRYTMEVFSPLYEGGLENQIDVCKKLQDMLGDMHDCDVWMDYLPQFMEEERAYSLDYFGHDDSFRILEPGLRHLQQYLRERRLAIYKEFAAYWKDIQEQNIWNDLKQFIQLTLDEKCKNQVI